MSMFDWDIVVWVKQQLPEDIRQEPLISDFLFRYKPIKVLYDEFIAFRTQILKKMRYNSQTIILRNLLNDMFDPTLRRIKVITTYDIIDALTIYQYNEDDEPYIYTDAELTADPTLPKTYIYQVSELGVLYDFIVEAEAGSLTAEQIVRLKAIVNYYRLAGKRPGYFYSNGTQY